MLFTIWYYLLESEGSKIRIEGPTPEEVVVDVHTTPWEAVKMEVQAWEDAHPLAEVEWVTEGGIPC